MSRIAYIFFGQVKNFDEKQYEAFEQNVGNKLKDHDVDYFLTTSRSSHFSNKRHDGIITLPQKIDYSSIRRHFDFKDVFFDDEKRDSEENIKSLANKILEFGEAWRESPLISIENSLKQLYGLEYFWHKFKCIAEDYDFFILSRSDLFHTHPLDVACFDGDVDLLTPYYDNLSQIDYGQFGGLNDRFAIANNILSLAVYCSRYSSIKNKQEYYHAETYLLEHAKKHRLKLGKINNFLFMLYRANREISDFVGIKKDACMNRSLSKIDRTYFINLDRRVDRLNEMYRDAKFFMQRFSAKDVKGAVLDDEVKMLFPNTWKSRNKAEICCAISHFRLWRKLIKDESAENYLILEDDTVFEGGFFNFWNEVFSCYMPSQYSIIYLGGCQPWNKPRYKDVLKKYNNYFFNIKYNNFFGESNEFWHMNANSYILSKTAAISLYKQACDFGIDAPIDHFMQKHIIDINKSSEIFHLNPLMTQQRHEVGRGIKKDNLSEIRGCKDTFEAQGVEVRAEGSVRECANKIIFLDQGLFEEDFLMELLAGYDYEKVFDVEMELIPENSIVVYSDIISEDTSIYTKEYVDSLEARSKKLKSYFEGLRGRNCILFHLSDEHCHASVSHYEYFSHVFRQYYRKDVERESVTFIPLGYKKGFNL